MPDIVLLEIIPPKDNMLHQDDANVRAGPVSNDTQKICKREIELVGTHDRYRNDAGNVISASQNQKNWGRRVTDMAVATMEKVYLGTTIKKGMNTCRFRQIE